MVADRLEQDRRALEVAADPVVWTTEVMQETLWSKQREICYSVRDNRRTAVQASHSVGKSFVSSRLACWWLSAHSPGDAFVVTSAPTWAQVRAVLWREIGRAHSKGNLIGTTTETEWKIDKEIVAFGRKPSDYSPTAFQGIHARYVLVILDEACGIPENLWEAADTLISNENSRILAIGNPDDPTSEFQRVCTSEAWNTIRINAFESPNFTDEGAGLPREVLEQLISPVWVEEKRRKWGTHHPFWQSKVLGLFPQQSSTALFPLHWLLAAQRRELEPGKPIALGVDVARFGTDKTVMSVRRGDHFRVVYSEVGNDTMKTASVVLSLIKRYVADVAGIDTVGVGGGVYDRCAEDNAPVAEMQAAGRARDYDSYANCRAEWAWWFRERLERGEVDLDEEDDELIEQLAGLRFKIDTRGRIVLESKDDMKKRGMDSPDRADSVILAGGAPATVDWNAAYGVIICLGCGRGFLEDTERTACPHCKRRIES